VTAPGLAAERTTLARVRTALSVTMTALIVSRAVRDDAVLVVVALACAALSLAVVVWPRAAHRVPLVAPCAVTVVLAAVVAASVLRG
jgi:hypothetical protein